MAPIKFDDHIRERLQEREIHPSNSAWDRLNKEINHTSKKTTKIPWYAIAASIAGLIVIVSLVFLNQTNSRIDTNIIVESKTNTINKDVPNEPIFKAENNEIVSATETQNKEESNSETPIILENQKAVSSNKIKNKNSEIAFINSENNAINSHNQESVVVSENEINNSETNFIDLKVAEVVAEVTAIKKSNKEVTEDEINALLEKAQFEIQSQRLLENKKVDATALLNLVEEELEINFRDKVFDALGEQFEKVRTAVVDRNN